MAIDVNHLFLFIKVVESGSFTEAAKQLGLPKSSVSAKLSQLEAELGVRVLQRTTRRVSMTEMGEKIYESASRIAAETEDIKALVAHQSEEPSGILRVTAPLDLGTFIVESLLESFLARYPKLEIEFDFSNRLVDLVREGFDLALRASDRSKDSSLIARPLVPISFGLYASPAWLARHPPLERLEELETVDTLSFHAATRRRTKADEWTFQSAGQKQTVSLRSRLRINDYLALTRATVAGYGVAPLPNLPSQALVKRGELQRVLPQWSTRQGDFFALYPSRRYLPAKTRAFVTFLQAELEKLML